MNQNPLQMMQMFNEFRKEYTPQKAQEKVQQLIATGKMNQQQLNQLQSQASEFMKLMNGFR